MGLETPADEAPVRLSIAGALGWGFLTAIAAGPFAMLLFAVALIAGDPSELVDKPLETLGAVVSLLTFGSVLAIFFAVIISWLPISVVGWLTQKAAGRWPAMRHAAAWAGVGAVTGGLCIAAVTGGIADMIHKPDRANWEDLRDFLVFGGASGLFAALFFRWLIAPARARLELDH